MRKDVIPPFKPKLASETDTSNFDPEFTNASMTGSLHARAFGVNFAASTPLSPTLQANFKGFTFVDESTMDEHLGNRDSKHLDSMDEEYEWQTNRMSGVVRTSGGGDEGIFGNDLDM